MKVAVVGASGFIGRACVEALRESCTVVAVHAPRLKAQGPEMPHLAEQVRHADVHHFAQSPLAGVDVLVNAAGIADAASTDLPALLGANALLPLLLQRAASEVGCSRFIHISSAAVQGRRELDETDAMAPESRYALSKTLGERLLARSDSVPTVRYRPTSVQGASRGVTQALAKLAESPFAVVAAPGNDPSPMTSAARVAEAVTLLATSRETPPGVVLHPFEGATTSSVLRALGGREPRQITRSVAKKLLAAGYATSRLAPQSKPHLRRLEVLMFGQRQSSTWLDDRLGEPTEGWLERLRDEMPTVEQERSRWA